MIITVFVSQVSYATLLTQKLWTLQQAWCGLSVIAGLLVCSMMESADAIDDSDDEVDYTKMDQGNKKGPVGRWDFDTQEEYSSYMSTKEALPKYVHVLPLLICRLC